ncbi:hypothetical protein OHC33_004622 [Knufia fluminis]|uniref:Uncharacterized protein n=1 Tax=Knufia fluminis TaxID=191047 RepID=A0AAN8I840_9EURO|nr:hypothetical protein OHC33_004622 [Knufia fluminis]
MMFLISLILTTSVALTAALPVSLDPRTAGQKFLASQAAANNLLDGKGAGIDVHKYYSGDGSADAGWPKMSDWVSFQNMFDSNAEIMKKACTNLDMPPGSDTTNEEIALIWDGIQNAAIASGVDHRFILAIMMQESKGCVRVYKTANGNGNPGLMQDHEGAYNCNPMLKGDYTRMVKPCPADQINGMVQDGVGGTTVGAGLAEYLNNAVDTGTNAGTADMNDGNAQVYYQAARHYNSGSVNYANLDIGFSSNPCYAMDIANRLTGWLSAPASCNPGY